MCLCVSAMEKVREEEARLHSSSWLPAKARYLHWVVAMEIQCGVRTEGPTAEPALALNPYREQAYTPTKGMIY